MRAGQNLLVKRLCVFEFALFQVTRRLWRKEDHDRWASNRIMLSGFQIHSQTFTFRIKIHPDGLFFVDCVCIFSTQKMIMIFIDLEYVLSKIGAHYISNINRKFRFILLALNIKKLFFSFIYCAERIFSSCASSGQYEIYILYYFVGNNSLWLY